MSQIQPTQNSRPVISIEGWIARDGFYTMPLDRKLQFFTNKPHRSDSDREQKWYAQGFKCDLPTHILRKLGYHNEPVKARLEVRLDVVTNCDEMVFHSSSVS